MILDSNFALKIAGTSSFFLSCPLVVIDRAGHWPHRWAQCIANGSNSKVKKSDRDDKNVGKDAAVRSRDGSDYLPPRTSPAELYVLHHLTSTTSGNAS